MKAALEGGWTVPYSLRTLLEDGWSALTVRKVLRAEPKEDPTPTAELPSEDGSVLRLMIEDAEPIGVEWRT